MTHDATTPHDATDTERTTATTRLIPCTEMRHDYAHHATVN
jgi:hypothetical protein